MEANACVPPNKYDPFYYAQLTRIIMERDFFHFMRILLNHSNIGGVMLSVNTKDILPTSKVLIRDDGILPSNGVVYNSLFLFAYSTLFSGLNCGL